MNGEVETRAARRMRTAKIWSSDTGGSGKCSMTNSSAELSGSINFEHKRLKTNGDECIYTNRDLDLLITEGTTDRFVGAVAKDEVDKKMRVIEAVVDSGAEESVAPPGCFPGAVVPSRMSRAGGKYRAANGARIPNLGQVKVPFMNEEGDKCGIMFQVAEVERPLISATQLAASGNAVIIDGKGARIVNMKTKKVMRLVKRGGVYVLRMRVKADPGVRGHRNTSCDSDSAVRGHRNTFCDSDPAPGFPGPGR
jgi:hypothetical protein